MCILAMVMGAFPFINGILISDLHITDQGYSFSSGYLFHLFGLIIFMLIFGLLYLLFKSYIDAKGLSRPQFFYIFVGVLIFATVSILYLAVFPSFGYKSVVPYDALSSIFWVGFTTYAIIAKRLFDIRVIIKKTIIYSALLGFVLISYSLIVFSFAALFGGQQGISVQNFIANIIAALLIAFGFDPLKKWLTDTTDKYLFRGEYRPQEVTNQLSTTLSNVIDLDEAVLSMMQIITQEMRLKSVATFILTSFEDTIEVKRVKQIGYKDPSLLHLTSNGPIISYFSSLLHNSTIVTEELIRDLNQKESYTQNRKFDFHRIAVKLQKLRASVSVPIFVKEKLIGIFIVGDKLSDDIFSNQDLDMLKIVANQTAAAIEKARFYEEDQLKTEFVSIASHELLTPTAAIEGYLSMILDDKIVKVDDKTREFLDKVYKSSRRLAELVKDLLQVSRIEAGRIVVDLKPFDLVEKITDTIDSLKISADEKKISLNFISPKEKMPSAFADPEKIVQALTNFIGNAIKYNKEGGKVDLTIVKESGFFTVSIKDNGIGMSKETVNHLFEKFYRSPEIMSYYQGTGLGLYISKNLIEKMNGKVEVQSEEGKGSTFLFTVPIYSGHEKRQVIGDPKLMTPEQRHAAGIEDGNGVVKNS